jgi:hypothetical protein
VHLQTISKLLWTLHKDKSLPLINADNTDLRDVAKSNPAANEREKARIVLVSSRFNAEKAELATIGRAEISLEERVYRDRGQAHGPPKLRAA